MNCWHFKEELVWGGDFDFEDYGIDDRKGIVSNLSCQNCSTYVEVYHTIKES